jgi:hypothetical protein
MTLAKGSNHSSIRASWGCLVTGSAGRTPSGGYFFLHWLSCKRLSNRTLCEWCPRSLSIRPDSTLDRNGTCLGKLWCQLWFLAHKWSFPLQCNPVHNHPLQHHLHRRTLLCPLLCHFRNSLHKWFPLEYDPKCMTCILSMMCMCCIRVYTLCSYFAN